MNCVEMSLKYILKQTRPPQQISRAVHIVKSVVSSLRKSLFVLSREQLEGSKLENSSAERLVVVKQVHILVEEKLSYFRALNKKCNTI